MELVDVLARTHDCATGGVGIGGFWGACGKAAQSGVQRSGMTAAGAVQAPLSLGTRIHVGSQIYNEIAEFLFEEAGHLDRLDLLKWAEMLAEDLVYTVPMRLNRPLADQAASVVRS